MNEHFVNIKVDREERPDVDSIYMQAVQQHDRSGRVAHERIPDPGRRSLSRGHLLPSRSRATGIPSFASCWKRSGTPGTGRRGEVDRSADALTQALERGTSLTPPGKPSTRQPSITPFPGWLLASTVPRGASARTEVPPAHDPRFSPRAVAATGREDALKWSNRH